MKSFTLVVAAATALLASTGVLAQSNTSDTASSATRTSSSSSSSSSSRSRTSGSSTRTSSGVAATGTMSVQLPPLIQCAAVTFTFSNAPAVQKHLAFFEAGSTNIIEIYDLPTAYTSLTTGSFTWKVDLPVGLAVGAMLYVFDSAGNQKTATTPDATVLAGTDSSCLAQNAGQNTQSILSYASKLNPAFIYTAPGAETTAGTGAGNGASTGDSGGSTPVGPIVGGVVGGVVAITILALFLFYLKRKHQRAHDGTDGYSVYSGRSEKHRGGQYGGGSNYAGSTLGGLEGRAPPGTYFTNDEYGNPILVALPPSAPSEVPMSPMSPGASSAYAPSMPTSPAPRQTAALGTLPEPMGDEAPSTPPRHSPPPTSSAGPLSPFTPVTESSHAVPEHRVPMHGDPTSPSPAPRGAAAQRGAEGLADPSSFSPLRQPTQRTDTFYTADTS